MSVLDIHHLGLSVKNLDATSGFFTEVLGYEIAREVPDYPARFVTNGSSFITLWQTDADAVEFDRRANVGLHHFALRVDSLDELAKVFEKAQAYADVVVDFAPTALGEGPAQHCMVFEPSGIRMEFIWIPKSAGS
jgi:lactoylglutathione lyase